MLISFYPSVCLPTYLSFYLSIFLSIFLPIYFLSRLFIYSFIRLFVYESINPSSLLRIHFFVNLPTCLSFFRLFRYPFIYLPFCLSIFLPLPLSLHLFTYLFSLPPVHLPVSLAIDLPNYLLVSFPIRLDLIIISFENSLFIYTAAFLFAYLPNMAPKKIEAEPLVAILKRVPPCLQAATSWRTSAVRPKSLGFRV